jgi:hypothetical protein
VELYADAIDGDGPVRQEMKRLRELVGAVYGARASAARSIERYTPRMMASCSEVSVNLEAV